MNSKLRHCISMTRQSGLWLALLAILLCLRVTAHGQENTMTDRETSGSKASTLRIQKLWDYFDPAGSRARFEELRPEAEQSGDPSFVLELETQIARTLGLEAQYDSAHAVLDKVEAALNDSTPIARIRYLLERGRTYRSSGEVDKSRPLFEEAYKLGRKYRADFLAIDAAHMAAIVADSSIDKHRWNLTGVRMAETTRDSLAHNWLGSLNNNMGWDYFDAGQYAKALRHFQAALEFWEQQGKQKRKVQIARWSVAKALRVLGSVDEALAIQLALQAELDEAGNPDGYVFEELGELYLARGDSALARQYMAQAYAELSKDQWMVKNEQERLERLRTIGGVTDDNPKD